MAPSPPDTAPASTKAWERRTWVDRVTWLTNVRDHVHPGIPALTNHQHAPSMYMTLLYNGHYTLSTTGYHTRSDTWFVHGTDSLQPAK